LSSRPPFRCETHSDRGQAQVRPVGELDIATVPEVDQRLRELRQAGHDRLVLDLRATTFMDSSGLRLILTWHDEAARDGVTFGLIAGEEVVQRVFDTTRVRELLTFVEPAPGA
jgi:anti-sigma B factor antagonist